jgi:lipid-binding SYLF domain-containing protein
MRVLVCALLLSVVAAAGEAENKRLQASAEVLAEIMKTGDNAIPQNLMEKAACAVIVPGMKKGGFIVGAKFGRGFATCRKGTGVGWSAPSGVRIEGGSVGFQIGGAEVDIILLVMNKKGMDRLTSSQFTLGGEASVAAGPVGRDTQAQTDATMRAEILSWSRTRGVFGGIALQGATLRRDTDVDTALYGPNKPVLEILDGHVAPPAGASALLAALNKYSSRPNK